jgi:hypothetical protein
MKAQEPLWLVKLKQQKWMDKVAQLKLLQSNRAEAEKILGEPDEKDSEVYLDYLINNAEVSITYTTDECNSIDGTIPKMVIEDIDFYPNFDISFSRLVSKLKIPLKQFELTWVHDVVGAKIYSNEQYGITFNVGYDRLSSIEFSIPEDKNYNCVPIQPFLSQLEKIKEIKLLEANRDDARKIFADYKFERSNHTEYKEKVRTDFSTVEFIYSEGKCEDNESDGYETSEWNIESVKIWPENRIVPKDFGINLSQFQKEKMYQNLADNYIFYDKAKGLSFEVYRGKIVEINFFPSLTNNPLMCNKKRAKMLSSTKSLFDKRLSGRLYQWSEFYAFAEKVTLSREEIIISCNSSNKTDNKSCQDNSQSIDVSARSPNPHDDVLTYNYTVSGGKIIGKGAKVQWDLSGVKPGTYSITAAVDDGCGFCGKSLTKKVVVKRCPDCQSK